MATTYKADGRYLIETRDGRERVTAELVYHDHAESLAALLAAHGPMREALEAAQRAEDAMHEVRDAATFAAAQEAKLKADSLRAKALALVREGER